MNGGGWDMGRVRGNGEPEQEVNWMVIVDNSTFVMKLSVAYLIWLRFVCEVGRWAGESGGC